MFAHARREGVGRAVERQVYVEIAMLVVINKTPRLVGLAQVSEI